MKMYRLMLLSLAIAGVIILLPLATAQSGADSGASSSAAVLPSPGTTSPPPALMYIRPTEKTKLRNYFFDTFGPYPIAGAAISAGINQLTYTPPEWQQGASGYGKRYGSNFAIAAVSTTTRYAFERALHEDGLYYRCACKGAFPRLSHAVISTFTARRGEDGHRVFSFPAVIAPYAGTMTAVYGWYPNRYSAKDAFRMGNYSLMGYVGGNIALEFLYSGPHSWLSRMHLNNGHGAPTPDSPR
jgi:hypothetical protein